jgi:hypothetical protein
MLIVDDVGRQRLPVAEMLNRWMTPLEQGTDQLILPGGHTETVPFDATVVFVTNLAPQQVFDDAFLRRIGYKVALGALSDASYRALLRRQCRLRGIDYDERAVEHLLRLHVKRGQPLLAGYRRFCQLRRHRAAPDPGHTRPGLAQHVCPLPQPGAGPAGRRSRPA